MEIAGRRLVGSLPQTACWIKKAETRVRWVERFSVWASDSEDIICQKFPPPRAFLGFAACQRVLNTLSRQTARDLWAKAEVGVDWAKAPGRAPGPAGVQHHHQERCSPRHPHSPGWLIFSVWFCGGRVNAVLELLLVLLIHNISSIHYRYWTSLCTVQFVLKTVHHRVHGSFWFRRNKEDHGLQVKKQESTFVSINLHIQSSLETRAHYSFSPLPLCPRPLSLNGQWLKSTTTKMGRTFKDKLRHQQPSL